MLANTIDFSRGMLYTLPMEPLPAVFRERPAPEARKLYYHEDSGLYIQPLRRTDDFFTPSEPSQIVSTCLFVFPQRVKENSTYASRVQEYVRGIESSLAFLSLIQPKWILRLYVDYSTARPTTDPDELLLQRYIGDAVRTLARSYPRVLQVVAVRLMRPGYQTGRTFMPSIWRFLPMFDLDVDTVVCVDADNPFAPLYMHFIDQWLHSDKAYFFLIPDAYTPPHCALSSTLNDYALCPVAQFWGARRFDKTSTVAPDEVLHAMLQMTTDPDFSTLVQNVDDITALLPAVGKVIGRSVGWHGVAAIRTFAELHTVLSAAVREAITTSEAPSLQIALREKSALAFVTGFLFSRVLSRHNPTVMWLNAKALQETIQQMVTSSAYGVDEWLLQVPLAQSLREGSALVLRTSQPDTGLQMHDHVQLAKENQDGNGGGILDVLSAVAPRHPPFGEVVARTIVFLRLLSPGRAATGEMTPKEVVDKFREVKRQYYQRLFLLARKQLKRSGWEWPSFASTLDELFLDTAFFARALKRLMYVLDPRMFAEWQRRTGVRYDDRKKRFWYMHLQGFQAVKNILIQGVFLTIDMLHMFKESSSSEATRIAW